MRFSMNVVWCDGLEWRITLPDGRYVAFSSPKDLEKKAEHIQALIMNGIKSQADSLKGWIEQ